MLALLAELKELAAVPAPAPEPVKPAYLSASLPPTNRDKEREIRWMPATEKQSEDSHLAGELEILSKGSSRYKVHEFPADEGRGFLLIKTNAGSDPLEDSYSVFAGEKMTCECKGFYAAAAKGEGSCKHTAAITALIDKKWL